MERDKVLDTIKELPEEFELEDLIEKLIFVYVERLKSCKVVRL